MTRGVGTNEAAVGAGVGDGVAGAAGMLKAGIGVGWAQADHKPKTVNNEKSVISFLVKILFLMFINPLITQPVGILCQKFKMRKWQLLDRSMAGGRK